MDKKPHQPITRMCDNKNHGTQIADMAHDNISNTFWSFTEHLLTHLSLAEKYFLRYKNFWNKTVWYYDIHIEALNITETALLQSTLHLIQKEENCLELESVSRKDYGVEDDSVVLEQWKMYIKMANSNT